MPPMRPSGHVVGCRLTLPKAVARRPAWHCNCYVVLSSDRLYRFGDPVANRWEESMSVAAIVGILVALVVVAGIAWYFLFQRRRTEALQARYGPEYSRAVRDVGSQRAGEAELLKRQERVEHLEIRPLVAEQSEAFLQRWGNVQALFVDDPGGAISRADALVEEVMKVRGYPVADFDQRAADLSVHHARVLDNYRGAREIADRHRRNAASTEDLRKAMVYYRELFTDLLEDRENAAQRAVERGVERPVAQDVARGTETTSRGDEARTSPQPTKPRTDKDLRP
jgi:hypothetical protein